MAGPLWLSIESARRQAGSRVDEALSRVIEGVEARNEGCHGGEVEAMKTGETRRPGAGGGDTSPNMTMSDAELATFLSRLMAIQKEFAHDRKGSDTARKKAVEELVVKSIRGLKPCE